MTVSKSYYFYVYTITIISFFIKKEMVTRGVGFSDCFGKPMLACINYFFFKKKRSWSRVGLALATVSKSTNLSLVLSRRACRCNCFIAVCHKLRLYGNRTDHDEADDLTPQEKPDVINNVFIVVKALLNKVTAPDNVETESMRGAMHGGRGAMCGMVATRGMRSGDVMQGRRDMSDVAATFGRRGAMRAAMRQDTDMTRYGGITADSIWRNQSGYDSIWRNRSW